MCDLHICLGHFPSRNSAEAIDKTQVVSCGAGGVRVRVCVLNTALTQIPAGLVLEQAKARCLLSYGADDGMNVCQLLLLKW